MKKYDPEQNGALCYMCPLRGSKPVPPVGPPDPEIVIVGETPGYQEEVRGEPFVGPSGVQLNDLLREVGFTRKKAWVTNTILCRPAIPGVHGAGRYDFKEYLAWVKLESKQRRKRGEDPIPSPVECCAIRLRAELMRFDQVARDRGDANGIVVIPMGNYAAEAITGRKGIMKIRGSPFLNPLEEEGK